MPDEKLPWQLHGLDVALDEPWKLDEEPAIERQWYWRRQWELAREEKRC